MRSWGLASIADNAILMISELVTNAILHGGEGAILTLTVDDLKIRAEVRDSSPAMPVVRGYSATATTGRGMVIVDALSAAWGTYAVDGGKVVWFELSTDSLQPKPADFQERPTAGNSVLTQNSPEFKTTATASLDDEPGTFRARSGLHLVSAGAWS